MSTDMKEMNDIKESKEEFISKLLLTLLPLNLHEDDIVNSAVEHFQQWNTQIKKLLGTLGISNSKKIRKELIKIVTPNNKGPLDKYFKNFFSGENKVDVFNDNHMELIKTITQKYSDKIDLQLKKVKELINNHHSLEPVSQEFKTPMNLSHRSVTDSSVDVATKKALDLWDKDLRKGIDSAYKNALQIFKDEVFSKKVCNGKSCEVFEKAGNVLAVKGDAPKNGGKKELYQLTSPSGISCLIGTRTMGSTALPLN